MAVGGWFIVRSFNAQPSMPSQSTSETTTPASAQTPAKSYTLAEVARHADRSSCWTVVRGEVYDVTNFIDKHPGGPERVLALCGKDGTEAFTQQHGGKTRPEAMLASLKIGTVAQGQ